MFYLSISKLRSRTGAFLNDFYVLDLEVLTWTDLTTRMSGVPPSQRGFGSMATVGDNLFVFGGFDSTGKHSCSN